MSRAKILIADDSPTIRNILTAILNKEGYATVIASDGIEAIKAAYREQPDLILLDIFMPLMNGYQVCRLLKNDKTVSSIPILILTSAEGKQEKFWSLETGADEFMVKNFDTPQVIIRTVDKFVAGYLKIKQNIISPPAFVPSDPLEILSKVSVLLDKQLYDSTVQRVKLEAILLSLAEGLVNVDAEKVITAFNPAMEEISGLSAKDVLGVKCCKIFSGSLCKGRCHFEDAFLYDKNTADIECEFRPAPNKKVSALSSISLLKDDEGKLVGAVCVFKDITRIKEIEQMRSDFVSMVTHELKAPLAIIKASANNLLDGLTGEISPKQKDCLEIIANTAQRLLGLANDLLDLAKLESGSYELTLGDVDANEIINNCLKDFEALTKQKKIRINSFIGRDVPKIRADFNKLEQVFINLVSNAVKFTSEGGEIRVGAVDKADCLEFYVSDTGKGIPLDAQERIFNKFQQIYDREARRQGGTGLGLSVVKAIVEAHKGKIRVESAPGKGSKFIFTIPK